MFPTVRERVQRGFASGLMHLGLARGERVAIYLEKRFETVIASFGAPAAGGVFVPLNPLLKPEQVGFILRDCDVRVLVTSPERLALLAPMLTECPALRRVVDEVLIDVERCAGRARGDDASDVLALWKRRGKRAFDVEAETTEAS